MSLMTPNDPSTRIHTPLCELLNIPHPIVLGGMASGTSVDLVAAVSEAGGLGILGASGRPPAEIREATARLRDLTTAPFGLNVLLFYHDDATLDTVLAQRPAVASFAWPTADQTLSEVFARAHDVGARVMHMVARLDEARRAAEAGADIIVAQGSEGGDGGGAHAGSRGWRHCRRTGGGGRASARGRGCAVGDALPGDA
jgi:enoyl-[acyl-carrier protein] reductase II